MEYDNGYKEAIDMILDLMKSRKPYTIEQVSVLQPLYNEIVNGMIFAKKQFDNKKVVITVKNGISMHIPSSSRFIPREINDNIAKNMKRQVEYKLNIHHRKVSIRFGLFDNKYEMTQLEYFAQMVISWIHTISKYAEPMCGRSQLIDIYLTGYKKVLPKSYLITLGPINCNSGLSTVCAERNEITIFRKEEWFKVFLHESFHSFGLEPNHAYETQLSNYIARTMPIKPSVRVSEAYVETWARIINVVYSAIINSESSDEFYNLLRFSLQLESLFSVYQVVRVLNFMNIDYDSIIDKTSVTAKMMYKEDTNVFAYYIISAAFMQNAFGFIRWCSNHNTKLLKFYNSTRTSRSFERFMHECLYGDGMIAYCKLFGSQELTKHGLRFSIVESVI
jgi:hypothetical protein